MAKRWSSRKDSTASLPVMRQFSARRTTRGPPAPPLLPFRPLLLRVPGYVVTLTSTTASSQILKIFNAEAKAATQTAARQCLRKSTSGIVNDPDISWAFISILRLGLSPSTFSRWELIIAFHLIPYQPSAAYIDPGNGEDEAVAPKRHGCKSGPGAKLKDVGFCLRIVSAYNTPETHKLCMEHDQYKRRQRAKPVFQPVSTPKQFVYDRYSVITRNNKDAVQAIRKAIPDISDAALQQALKEYPDLAEVDEEHLAFWLTSVESLFKLTADDVQANVRQHPWLLISDLLVIKSLTTALTRVLSVAEAQVARMVLSYPDVLDLEPMDLMEHLMYLSSTMNMSYDTVVQLVLGCPAIATAQPRDLVRSWAEVRSCCSRGEVMAAAAATTARNAGSNRGGSEGDSEAGDAFELGTDEEFDCDAEVARVLAARPGLLSTSPSPLLRPRTARRRAPKGSVGSDSGSSSIESANSSGGTAGGVVRMSWHYSAKPASDKVHRMVANVFMHMCQKHRTNFCINYMVPILRICVSYQLGNNPP
ncbi:hypothetical protein VOLCADRAFT_104318 [Volvox carteri f. nagariensis]|uniref:Uncharacterized protein n=1 Tax=Volvox carteri f. nagariensis TaxID=3068 RepID=D8TSU4_VOLCA|nr:uncharacterized protein VOLCADRAFT_104318 [Volvox carteri f. nagariensis]EFJ49542.1 hypothetical protein VOLCADRAFT_104318 [Volvox carteri f. nagariensis]|eukprot:XP_002949523.1 hypothetical protein VOLCADRAFT_104318 [Volvox carteri f. nagariensis]